MRNQSGIPTLFQGIEYRSLHEAKWAVFMHVIGWDFTYEPFEGNGYIPDFIIHGEHPFFLEVKPAVSKAEYEREAAKVERGLMQFEKDVLIVGAHPLRGPTSSFGMDDMPSVGWMGEYRAVDDWNPTASMDWETAAWIECRKCSNFAVFHTMMTYASRPCGHYSGDHYLGLPNTQALLEAWAVATNAAKYRHKPRARR